MEQREKFSCVIMMHLKFSERKSFSITWCNYQKSSNQQKKKETFFSHDSNVSIDRMNDKKRSKKKTSNTTQSFLYSWYFSISHDIFMIFLWYKARAEKKLLLSIFWYICLTFIAQYKTRNNKNIRLRSKCLIKLILKKIK